MWSLSARPAGPAAAPSGSPQQKTNQTASFHMEEGAASPSRGKDPHPCMQTALESRHEQEQFQQIEWLFRDHLERHKAALESTLQEQHEAAMKQTAEAFRDFKDHLEEHNGNMVNQLEAAALKLKRQEEHFEEILERFTQKASMGSLGRRTSSAYGSSAAENQELISEELANKLQANCDARFMALQQQSLAEIKGMLQRNPLMRQAEPPQVHFGNREEETIPAREPGEVQAQVAAIMKLSSEEDKTKDDHRFVQSLATGVTNRGGTIGSNPTSASKQFTSDFYNSDRALKKYREHQAKLDLISASFILLNCLWMGVEAELGIDAARSNEELPDWATFIEISFVLIFSVELAARAFIQGPYFMRCPNVRMNLFDGAIVMLQVCDSVFVFYNVSWLRSLRVLRLFNAARIVRGIEYIRQLRLLLSALSACLAPLMWIIVIMVFVVYLASVFLMQTIQGHVKGAETLDPALLKYYGSMGNCMLTLFMAFTGGAPWEVLLQPLADISVFFVVTYVLYVIFMVCGLMSIITAIFVESTKVLVQKDGEMYVKDLMTSKDSAVNKIRALLQDMDVEQDGWLSSDELENALLRGDFLAQMKEADMEPWEARGMFQLLDSDAIGRITVDDFLYGIIRLKCKDQSVDLATVMYENKRILTRLLAFMRFAEDHFRNIQQCLGIATKRTQNLEQYLQDANNQAKAGENSRLSVMLGGGHL